MDIDLSLTGKRWVLAPQHGREGTSDDAMALIAFLKHARGLADAPEGNGGAWHNHRLFPDAAKAADRVNRAVRDGEIIALFGDYDCDGITSAAQIMRMLRRRGADPIVRLPHRVRDGYGLKEQHVDEFAQAGVRLIITVDTGVSAHAAVTKANAAGIDVIILDHHHLLTAPDAYAILHPALAPDFPHPHPSAAGVVFYFLHAMEGDDWEGRDTDLALATFGTVADLVPLTGNNRRLVQEGLRAIARLPAGPVRTFVEQATGGRTVTSTDIAFRIAPRINAAGRMADPVLALKALLEGGPLINDLETLNSLRQDETNRSLERALQELVPKPDGSLPEFLSIASTSYPHGILGLLAGKLTDRYGRPSMAVHIEAELCTASLRSTPGYNIVEALERVKHLLLSFGGHAQAAGCTFALEQYITLTEQLERDAAERIPTEHLIPALAVDAVLPAESITHGFCNAIAELEPFGQGNPEPLFLIENVRLENMRRVGAEGRHLQATVGGCKLIGFGLGGLMNDITGPVDIACRIGMDTWNGVARPQLFLVDIRETQLQAARLKLQEATA